MTTTKDAQPSSAKSNVKTDTCKPGEGSPFNCEFCKIDCLMSSIFDAHCQGEKHKKMKAMMHGEDDPKKGQKKKELQGKDDPKKGKKIEELEGKDYPKKGKEIEELEAKDDPKKGKEIEELEANDDPKKGKEIEELEAKDDPKKGKEIEELEGYSRAKDIRNLARFLKNYAYMTNREPLIGLHHVIENTHPDCAEPRFTCDLCEYCSELGSLIEHLNSFEHRKAYIAKEYPYLLKVPPAQNEDRVAFLKRMALDVERDEGVKMYKSEILQDDALQFLKTFEIDSDEEALSVMNFTQNLSEMLKTYCLKITNAEKSGNAANIPGQVNSLNLPLADNLGRGNLQMPLDPQNGTWNQQALHSTNSVDLSLEVKFHNQLSQPVPHIAGIDNCSPHILQNQNFQPLPSLPITASQFTFSLNRSGDEMNYKPSGNQPNSYGRISNVSELRPYVPTEPHGSGSFPSEGQCFENKYNLSDRGPLPGSLAGGPSPRSISDRIQEYQAYRNNQSNPSANIGRNASWTPDPERVYVRDQDQGSGFRTTSGSFSDNFSSSYTSGASNTRIVPDTPDPPQRSNNLDFPKYRQTNSVVSSHNDSLRTSIASNIYRGLPQTMADAGRRELWERDSLYMKDFPKHTSMDPLVHRSSEMYSAGIGNRMLTGNSFARATVQSLDFPRSAFPSMPALGATSGFAADIVALVKGKDVKAATMILNNLAPTHPALQKVNIANLLNLLVQTGTIQ